MDTNHQEFKTVKSKSSKLKAKKGTVSKVQTKDSFYTLGQKLQQGLTTNDMVISRRSEISDFNKQFNTNFKTIQECIDYSKRVKYALNNIVNVTEKDMSDTFDFLTDKNLAANSIKNTISNEQLNVTGFMNIMSESGLEALVFEYAKKKIVVKCGKKPIVVYGSRRVCRNGNSCTRADCYFNHPGRDETSLEKPPDSDSSSSESDEESAEEPDEEPDEEEEIISTSEPEPEPEPDDKNEESDSESD